MLERAEWIVSAEETGAAVEFIRTFSLKGRVERAALSVTCEGVYEAELNGRRVGDFILAPGCTAYQKRLQVQTYDVAALLGEQNTLTVLVGKGWHRGRISEKRPDIHEASGALIAELEIAYADGSREAVATDGEWLARPSSTVEDDIWDGETYDASLELSAPRPVRVVQLDRERLVPQEGETVREQETLFPRALFVTPGGERVLDFGQNLTGYVAFRVNARCGDRVRLTCAEVLDRDGNVYTGNYRGAKATMTYVCRDGEQDWKPRLTFYGFRYIRLDEWPGEARPEDFRAVAVYSDMRRTGRISTTDAHLNRLYENALWSQRGNFLDIPTDCPQRDERMGWTGDAQVFAWTACFNYDAERFFEKWLRDVRAEQRSDGSVPDTVPNFWALTGASTAWGDAITVVPWRLYLMYGDKRVLEENFGAMRSWVDYMTRDSREPFLWTCGEDEDHLWGKHYGDWLALDSPAGSYRGATPANFIASAFYAHSVDLLARAARVLGLDAAPYEQLHESIVAAFKRRFARRTTQTEHVLALAFGLTDDAPGTARALAGMIRENGDRLQTGFVGTPYLLHVLSENGYADVAYDLLLQERYPSWLYEVARGATTVWEHWDSLGEDGAFWSDDMNSFNHYAYGSVVDWMYAVAGGIRPDEAHPGFARAVIAPVPSKRIAGFEAEYASRRGTIRSRWAHTPDGVRYEIETPVPARVVIAGETREVAPGRYVFYSE